MGSLIFIITYYYCTNTTKLKMIYILKLQIVQSKCMSARILLSKPVSHDMQLIFDFTFVLFYLEKYLLGVK